MAKLDLEPGEYEVKIKEYHFGKLENEKQTPYIDICAEFPVAQDAWQKFFLSPKAEKYTRDKIKYLSADGTVGGMVGNTVSVVLKRDQRNPEYMVWDTPGGGAGGKSLAKDEQEEFEQRMNMLLEADGEGMGDLPF